MKEYTREEIHKLLGNKPTLEKFKAEQVRDYNLSLKIAVMLSKEKINVPTARCILNDAEKLYEVAAGTGELFKIFGDSLK